ncbi:hypothetical protein OIU85_002736 [Salix viminalis]|uniref:AAA+ ATPase domain-containing protein n=1 Tax=Salix viminalis TaxID=40686 RepID=A0A9Q0VPD2_SALVM|nr:hypothetical protein OIU85_002736 [Salix viminalis]
MSHKAPLQDIEFLPSKEFTPSESSKEASEQIMKALKDDKVNMIGLCGMGGVGKTTLVKEVGRRAKETQLFDVVLLATVSQNPNVMYMQDQMAESLGLQFDVKTKERRADRLWKRLKTEKKLLVILDDVWTVVNLKEIGIPFGDDHMGCKVLLTTRLRNICSYMECQPLVFLSILLENEAWALFKINAGLCDEDSNLNIVAKNVARECQGLPIALVTVGRALRDKSVVEWEVASTELKNSQFQHMEHIGEEENAYACLKLSYDYLKNEKTKLCFLLCCLFPEGYDISNEYLTRYAVGYEIYQDMESIEDARKEVLVAIKTLKDCCMLLSTETEERVKMHDLVRDVAIQISSKEHGFMVKAGLEKWPMSNKSFEGCKTISLMGNKLVELPEGLVCPHLKVLLLELDFDVNVPERFFEGMKEIEVLSLTGGCLSLQSLELSTNLQSLLLIHCECNDLISLIKLQRLKILGFIWCFSLKELPDEIGELKELRLLDVTGCDSLRRIPVNLIRRLKKLEELLIGDDSFKGWDAVGCDNTGGTNASLTELNSLSHLAVLSLNIPRVECIPRDFVFPKLLKYDIMLGNGESVTEYPTSTTLYLIEISTTSLNAKIFEQLFPTVSKIGFNDVEGLENIALSCHQMTNHGHGSQKNFLQRLEDVQVYGCRAISTMFPAKWQQVLNNLTSVEIENCESLVEVFELGEADEGINEENELGLLSSLTRLELKWLPELKCIWKGPTRQVSLRRLVHLELQSLDNLTFIFTPHLAQSLVNLKTLWIEHCRGLKHLIIEKDDEREIIPESLGFPKLKTLFISGCDELEYVFPVSVSPSLLNLEEMDIAVGANLKQLFYSGERDALTRDGIINFPRLRKLSLSRPMNFTAHLPSLKILSLVNVEGHEEVGDLMAQLQGLTNLQEIHITSCKGAQHSMQAGSFVPNRRTGHEWWQALKILEIKNCESLEEVFELGEADEGINEEKELLRLLSSITKLVLERLPELKCIWKGPTRHVSLRSLVHLGLRSLNKLTFIFTPHLAQSLVHLETLTIYGCKGLKHLIREKDDEREIILESLGFPKLKTLSISGCDELEYVFPVSVSPSLVNLETLTIYGCKGLKHLTKEKDGEREIIPESLGFPKLETLSINGCDELEYVFPVSVSPSLVNLETLQIESCSGLKHLIREKDDEREIIPESLGFLKLETLSINGCGELEYIFPVSVSPSLVNLDTLRIERCNGLKHLIREKDDEREIIPKSLGFQKLKTLFISGCDELEYVFPVSVSPSLVNLEALRIERCSGLKHLIREKDDEREIIPESLGFPKLETLSINGCGELEYIFPVSVSPCLVNLKTLWIERCSGLKHLIREKDDEREIIPESLGFPKLKTLFISGCDGLEYVFPVSVSPSLLNLEDMDIAVGANLKQIFYNGERDALTRDGIINFPRLRKLSLSRPMNFTAHLPSLKILSLVNVEGHEEVGDLLAQLQGHTNLKEICIKYCKGVQDRRTEHELSLLSLETLDLSFLPDMRCIWKGLALSHLTTLDVSYCEKLTHIFTGSMVASLVQLQFLSISDCEELEQIIAKDNDDENDQILSGSDLQSLCFPNLCHVQIIECNKLRSLFPVAMAAGLPMLETLDIRHSSQLLGVFGQDDHASPVNVEKQMVFPNLSSLSLYNLQSIVCFSLGLLSQRYLKVAEDSSTGYSEPRKKMEVKMV